jgi:hypothetical protein
MEYNEQCVVAIYATYIEDVNQLRTSRQTDNTTRLGVVTLLLGAQAFLINTVLTDVQGTRPSFLTSTLVSWVPIVAITSIGIVGWYFCRNWVRLLADTQRTLNLKFANLEAMERESPALQDAGAQLFRKERAERHRGEKTEAPAPAQVEKSPGEPSTSTSPGPLAAPSAPLTSARASRNRPQSGVSKRVTELARFFTWLFLVNSIGAPLAKVLIAFGPTWLAFVGVGLPR